MTPIVPTSIRRTGPLFILLLLFQAALASPSATYEEAVKAPTFLNLPDDLKTLCDLYKSEEKSVDVFKKLKILEKITAFSGIHPNYKIVYAEMYYRVWGDPILLEETTIQYPEYFSGRLGLIRHYYHSNDQEKLNGLMGFMKKHAAGYPELIYPIYKTYSQQGGAKKGFFELLKLAGEHPESKNLYYTIYRFSRDKNSPYLDRVLKLGYERYPADAKLGLEYVRFVPSVEKSLAIYQAIYNNNTGAHQAIEEGAQLALKANKNQQAVHFLRIWHQLDPVNPIPLLELKKLYSRTDQTGEIAPILEALVLVEPENNHHYKELIELSFKKNERKKAIEYCSRALGSYPHDKEIQSAAIRIITSLNHRGKLINALQHIQSLDPAAHEVQFQLAKLYADNQEITQALLYLEKAVANAPGNTEYQKLFSTLSGTDRETSPPRTLSQATKQ